MPENTAEPGAEPMPPRRLPFRRIDDPTPQIASKPAQKRPAVVQEPLEPLFEDEARPSTLIKPQNESVSVSRDIIIPAGGLIICIGLLWFGIFNAGSFYMQSTRFSGDLATIFYVWQVGTLLEIIGVVGGIECLKMLIPGILAARKS